ncbi:MAG: HD domain-containing protein [Armatimonadetes bacterium]|nr:HD domain-containing protein [Armatimonadota bacterium]MDW8121956.1 HD domain-containing protein [Armatimonadota bacterium]
MSTWASRLNQLIGDVHNWRQQVLSMSPRQAAGYHFCHQISDDLDQFLKRLYDLAFEKALDKAKDRYLPGHSEVAILATGGYGRKEMAPFSDLDIAFVAAEEDDPFTDTLLRECFRLVVAVFMDHTDIKVGYGFRPLSDIAIWDSQTQAALLDSRFVAGYEPLAEELHHRLCRQLDVLQFIHDRLKERADARRLTNDTPWVTEPNLKEGAGGLRDFHTSLWSLAALDRTPTAKAQESLEKVLGPDEWEQLNQAVNFLLTVRNWLHLSSQRRQDVLLREYHHRIAQDLMNPPADWSEETTVRSFHQRLFAALEVCDQTYQRVFRLVQHATISLGNRFLRKGPHLTLSDWSPPEDGHQVLKAFELIQRYNLEPDEPLTRWLCQYASEVEKVRSSPYAAQSFLKIVSGDGEAPFGKALRLMAQLGVLSVFLPEWGLSVRYVPSNPAHRFTVAEHLLQTVTELDQLRQLGARGQFPWVDLWAGVSDDPILFLSALLHDLGKPLSEAHHEEESARIAVAVGHRLALPEDRMATLERLVRHHLLLLSSARLLDVMAPETLRKVAHVAQEPAFLRMLLLHSFADARSVSPQTFTEMEERMLLDLYFGVLRILQEREEETLPYLTKMRTDELRQTLPEVSEDDIRAFCEAMPPAYLLNTPLSSISTHCRLVQQVRQSGVPMVEIVATGPSSFTELVVCAPDDPKPGMLSKIAGALFASDADIRNARVFTIPGRPALVLDTLWVTADGQPLSQVKARRVRETIASVLTGEVALEDLLLKAHKPVLVPVQVTSVTLRNDLSETHTVVHIVARDRKGLLYRLTRDLSALGLDIQTAKIVTWGDVAEDSFYVIRKGHGKVPDADLLTLQSRLLESLSQGSLEFS